MFRRHHAIVATLCLPLFALLAGCDEEKETPQVIFEGRLELGGSDNDCRDSGGLFVVGSFGNQALEEKVPAEPIKDGSPFNGNTVSVSCVVSPIGTDEFNVTGSVALAGAEGGLFQIDGTFKATGEQTGIHAIFSSRKSANAYEQKDRACVVRYTTPNQGVKAGAVWGEVTCPKVENTGAQTSCKGVAEFRFENCGQ